MSDTNETGTDMQTKAHELYAEGQAALAAGNFELALARFKSALQLSYMLRAPENDLYDTEGADAATGTVLIAISRTLRLANRRREAIAAYEDYLTLLPEGEYAPEATSTVLQLRAEVAVQQRNMLIGLTTGTLVAVGLGYWAWRRFGR